MRRAHAPRVPAVVLGLLGTLAVLAGCYLIFTKKIPFTHGHRINAVVASANQLRDGSPVRIAGVEVGSVTGVEQGPGDTQIVKLELDDDGLPVHTDARIRIRPRLFLEGGFFVELEPGSPGTAELGDEGTIPLPQTAGPVQFHQVLAAFDRPTRDALRGVIHEAATALEDGGAQALGRSASALKPALRDGAVVAEALRGEREHDAADVVRSASRVAAALGRRDDALASLLTDLNTTTRALASRDEQLSASLRELDAVMEQAPPALAELDRALPALERFAADSRPALRAAAPVLRDGARLLAQVRLLLAPGELPALVDDLRPLAASLPTLEGRLEALMTLLTPVADCLNTRALPVLQSKLDDGALSTGQPIWQELLHTATGLASGSQDFDGNGPAVRYLAGASDQSVSTGSVPGLGVLYGNAPEPVAGSSPRWLGRDRYTAFRPDARCVDQPAPDLSLRRDGATTRSRPGRGARGTTISKSRLLRLLTRPRRGGSR